MNLSNLKTVSLVRWVTGLGLVAALILVGLWLNNDKENTEPVIDAASQPVTVLITPDGFEPAVVKINVGDSVNWINSDTALRHVAANPYPERTSVPGLDSGSSVPQGGEYTFTFTEAGTFGYHDANQPTVGGTIIVE